MDEFGKGMFLSEAVIIDATDGSYVAYPPRMDRRWTGDGPETVQFFHKARIALFDACLVFGRDRIVRRHERHRYSMVRTHLVETDGFQTVGLLETEAVSPGGMELNAEAFAGKGDGGIEIYTIIKVNL